MKAFIYSIKNITNNKIYIGSTKSLVSRKYFHFYQLKLGVHHSTHLQKSYDKYGKDKFVFSLIEECTKEDRKDREIYHIKINNSYSRDCGYNVCEPNDDNFKHSTQTKNKMRNSEYVLQMVIPIDMYDLSGNFINTYTSICYCANQNKIHSIIIHDIINGKRKSYKGNTFVLSGTPFNYVPSSKQRNMTSYYK